MANGNTIAEIRSILSDKTKMAQGVVNRLQLSLMAEMYQNQLNFAEADAKYREEAGRRMKAIEDRQAEFEKRSVGMWIWRHPKAATVIMLSFYSFAISDIREPVMVWLDGVIQSLIKVL